MEHYPVLGSTRSWGAHLGEIAGVAIVGGIKGFYARHDGLQSSDCDAFYPAVGCLIPNTSIPTNLAIPQKIRPDRPVTGHGKYSFVVRRARRDKSRSGD